MGGVRTALVGFAAAVALAVVPGAALASSHLSWGGTWRMEGVLVVLTQRGSTVEGSLTYGLPSGSTSRWRLEGKVAVRDGRLVLAGSWKQVADRGQSAEALAHHLGPRCGPTSCYIDIATAFRGARQAARPGDRIVVFGSFHTVEAVLRIAE